MDVWTETLPGFLRDIDPSGATDQLRLNEKHLVSKQSRTFTVPGFNFILVLIRPVIERAMRAPRLPTYHLNYLLITFPQAVKNFFKSPAWKEVEDAFAQIWFYYEKHGFWFVWEQFKEALDLGGQQRFVGEG